MKKQQNVLFIVIDQLRADCIFGALADTIKLPNINALRDDAVSFKSHFSVTNPCGPSRASLLTGQYAMNHRAIRNGTPLAHNTQNVALEMRKLGFNPMLFGYTDISIDPRQKHRNDPDMNSYEQVMPGFDEKIEMRQEESYPWRSFLKQQGYNTPDYSAFYEPFTQAGQQPKINDPAFYKAEHSDSAFLTDQTINELQVRTDQSWFAHVTYIKPHPPLVAPYPYNSMYQNSDVVDAITHSDESQEAATHPYIATQLKMMQQHHIVQGSFAKIDKNETENTKALRALYMGLISEVDFQVGRLIDFLKQTNQYDSTLIVITSDHGEMLGDHHLWGKHTFYDKGLHVPLIIRDPKNTTTQGSSVDVLTESVDITPTILDWASNQQINMPPSINGRSLMPFVQDTPATKQTPWREHIFYELDFADPETPTPWEIDLKLPLQHANLAVIRDNHYKLVHFNGAYAPLLFNVHTDPHEMNDLAQHPEYQNVLLKMSQHMLNHRMTHANRTLSDMQVSHNGTINYFD